MSTMDDVNNAIAEWEQRVEIAGLTYEWNLFVDGAITVRGLNFNAWDMVSLRNAFRGRYSL